MSFDKKYLNRKDKHQQYRHSGKHNRTCRPHGGCPYCERNRLHNSLTKIKTADEKINELDSQLPGLESSLSPSFICDENI